MRRIPFFFFWRQGQKNSQEKGEEKSVLLTSEPLQKDRTGKTKKRKEKSKNLLFCPFFFLFFVLWGNLVCVAILCKAYRHLPPPRGIKILQRNLLGNSSPKSTRQEFLLATGHTHSCKGCMLLLLHAYKILKTTGVKCL